MRRLLFAGATLAALTAVGCESKTPTGPGTVTTQVTTSTTTTTTTTTISPAPPPPTIPPTTTLPNNIARRYVGASQAPTVPNDLTLFFQLLVPSLPSARTMVVNGPMASYQANGVYHTANGSGGLVKGSLDGQIDSGTFFGTITYDAPGCTAEREYTGTISAAFVTFSGGRTLRDCKDSPLAWNNLTLTRGDTVPPTTTVPTTIPQPCGYGLNPTGVVVPAAGANGAVDVITGVGCGWGAQSFVTWVRVSPPSGASGPGRAQYIVDPNPGGPRAATLVIGGQPFLISQN